MTVAITIRNVPDDVRDALAGRASRAGQSLQEYLSGELRRLATTPSVLEAVVQARLAAQTFPDLPMAEIVDAVDAGRR